MLRDLSTLAYILSFRSARFRRIPVEAILWSALILPVSAQRGNQAVDSGNALASDELSEIIELLDAKQSEREPLALRFERSATRRFDWYEQWLTSRPLEEDSDNGSGLWGIAGTRYRLLLTSPTGPRTSRTIDASAHGKSVRLTTLDVVDDNGTAKELPPQVQRLDSDIGTHLRDPDIGISAGMGWLGTRWSSTLRRVARPVALPETQVLLGRICTTVMYDAHPLKGEPDKYNTPVLVSFDVGGSGLALRLRWYRSIAPGLAAVYERSPDLVVRIDGLEYGTVLEVLLQELSTTRSNREFPSSVQFTYISQLDGAARVHQRVVKQWDAVDRIDWNDWLSPEIEPNSRVIEPDGTALRYLGSGKPELSEDVWRYEQLLVDARMRLGLDESGSVADPDAPFHLSSCGPNALLMLAHLTGKSVTLTSALHSLPEQERAALSSTAASLTHAAELLDIALVAVRTSWETAIELRTPFIGLMEGGPFPQPHFALVVAEPGGVQVYSPPDSQLHLPRNEFAAYYSGVALIAPEATLAEVKSNWPRRIRWASILSLVACVAVALTVLGRRRPSAIGLLICCAAVMSTGCAESETTPLEADSATEVALASEVGVPELGLGARLLPLQEFEQDDIAPVAPGTLYVARIPVLNATDTPLNVAHVKTSCVCSSVTVEPKYLNPGDVAEVTIIVDTTNRANQVLSIVASLHEDSTVDSQPLLAIRFALPVSRQGVVSVTPSEIALRTDGESGFAITLSAIFAPGSEGASVDAGECDGQLGARWAPAGPATATAMPDGVHWTQPVHLSVEARDPDVIAAETLNIPVSVADTVTMARVHLSFRPDKPITSKTIAFGRVTQGQVHTRRLPAAESFEFDGVVWTCESGAVTVSPTLEGDLNLSVQPKAPGAFLFVVRGYKNENFVQTIEVRGVATADSRDDAQ